MGHSRKYWFQVKISQWVLSRIPSVPPHIDCFLGFVSVEISRYGYRGVLVGKYRGEKMRKGRVVQGGADYLA